MSIMFYYVPEKNPDGVGFVPGIAQDDVTEEVYKAQPEHIQRMIAAAPYYRAGPGVRQAVEREAEAREKAAAQADAAAGGTATATTQATETTQAEEEVQADGS